MPSGDLDRRVARVTEALGVRFPVVQAGMGGVAVPELAAAVSEAGALGTIALYKLAAADVEAMVRDVQGRTRRPVGVNVIPEVAGRLLDRQIGAVLAAADRRLVVNSYGPPPPEVGAAVRAAGHTLLVQVGSPEQAGRAVEAGANVLVCQGVEAGGHHLGRAPLRDLLARVGAAHPDLPLLGAGGVADAVAARGVLEAGAGGVMCGTVFVATVESAAHPAYKAALVDAGADDTVITDRFSIGWPGRPHRALRSAVTDHPAPLPSSFIAWTTVMGERRPVPRGSASAPTVEADGAVEEMARYAGTGCGAIGSIRTAAQVTRSLGTACLAPAGPGPERDADDRIAGGVR